MPFLIKFRHFGLYQELYSSFAMVYKQGHWTASGPFCAKNSTPLHWVPPYLLYIFNFMLYIILSIFSKE